MAGLSLAGFAAGLGSALTLDASIRAKTKTLNVTTRQETALVRITRLPLHPADGPATLSVFQESLCNDVWLFES